MARASLRLVVTVVIAVSVVGLPVYYRKITGAASPGDLLRLNFEISFPKLACEFASVDVSDVLGMASTRSKL